MCECLDYDDGTRHTCEACVGDLEMFRDALSRSERRAEEAEARASEIDHWRVKARCYGDIVHGCSPALAAAGFPVDATQNDGAVGGIARSVNALASALASERAAREKAERERDEAKRLMDGCHLRIAELEQPAHPVFSRRMLESSLSRAVEALREIAGAECLRDEIMDCRAVAPDRPGKWCLSCTARAALAGQEVGRSWPKGAKSQNPDGTYEYDVPHDPDPNCPICGGNGYTTSGPERLVSGCACNWTPLAGQEVGR